MNGHIPHTVNVNKAACGVPVSVPLDPIFALQYQDSKLSEIVHGDQVSTGLFDFGSASFVVNYSIAEVLDTNLRRILGFAEFQVSRRGDVAPLTRSDPL